MKLSQLDSSTRAVLVWARVVAKNPKRASALQILQDAVMKFDEEHEDELLRNLLSFLCNSLVKCAHDEEGDSQ